MSRSFLVAALFAAAILPSLPAQQGCFGDDGFAAVPCCAPAQANLPAFPAFQLSGRYGCLKDCALEADLPIRVITSHIQVLCDVAFIPISVVPAAVLSPGFTGNLLAKYSRTWLEPDLTGAFNRQVWRFLINGDLLPTAGAAPCPLPPHPATLTRVHFHGHLDYACERDAAGNQVFRMAMSLHHLNGCIEHSFFSCNPLAGAAAHDDRSYHIVAPGTFSFSPVAVPSGPVVAESVRSTIFAPYTCLGEARVNQGSLVLRTRDWLCTPTPAIGPFAWTHYDHSATAFCAGIATTYRCLPIPAGFPLPPLPTGCAALPIGRWTVTAGSFPGTRTLATHWGVLNFQDPCNPNDPPFHFVQGVSTGEHAGLPFSSTAITRNWLDLQNMLNLNVFAGGTWTPPWGCLFVSKVVWNINIP